MLVVNIFVNILVHFTSDLA